MAETDSMGNVVSRGLGVSAGRSVAYGGAEGSVGYAEGEEKKGVSDPGWWLLAGPAILGGLLLGGAYYLFLMLRVAGYLVGGG